MQLVQDLEATQAELEALEAPEQLRWANDHFGSGFAVTTSFGTQSAVLLHLLVAVAPEQAGNKSPSPQTQAGTKNHANH